MGIFFAFFTKRSRLLEAVSFTGRCADDPELERVINLEFSSCSALLQCPVCRHFREEIQRIKAYNPDISHKEAFSTAAKNVVTTSNDTDEHDSNSTPATSSSGSRRGRGPARGGAVRSLGENERLKIGVNEYGQPCCENTAKLMTWIGIQARSPNVLPLNYAKWKDVPQAHKDDAWTSVLEKFILPDSNSSKEMVLKKLNDRWRDYKHELKKDVFDKYEIDEDRRRNIDKRIPEDQWNFLLSMWAKEESKALSTRNSHSRSHSKMCQSTGKTPFAVIRERKRLKHPQQLNPSRFDLFKDTHRKKDGSASDSVSAGKMADMDHELSQKLEELHEDLSVKESIFSKVVGTDTHGRVCMITFGITPKQYHGTATQRADRMSVENEALRGEIGTLKEVVNQLTNDNIQQKEKYKERFTQMESLLSQLVAERRSL